MCRITGALLKLLLKRKKFLHSGKTSAFLQEPEEKIDTPLTRLSDLLCYLMSACVQKRNKKARFSTVTAFSRVSVNVSASDTL